MLVEHFLLQHRLILAEINEAESVKKAGNSENEHRLCVFATFKVVGYRVSFWALNLPCSGKVQMH